MNRKAMYAGLFVAILVSTSCGRSKQQSVGAVPPPPPQPHAMLVDQSNPFIAEGTRHRILTDDDRETLSRGWNALLRSMSAQRLSRAAKVLDDYFACELPDRDTVLLKNRDPGPETPGEGVG